MFIIGWLIYGLLVGCLVRILYSGTEPQGFLWTLGIGVIGSYVGGLLNWMLGWGGSPISTSGLIMGVVGGLIFCWVYSKYIAGKLNV